MKKGDIMEGVVERVDFPNKGSVWTEDGYVTVKNTLPGQTVRFAITKKRQKNVEGRLLELVHASPLETREPVCDIFPDCGGCACQTMGYEEQLAMKAEQVKRLLEPVISGCGQTFVFEGIHPSPSEFSYRNKMEFSFGDAYKDGPLSLGLHRKNSRYDVLTASGCQLVHEDMTAILTAVLDYFQGLGIPYYHKLTHEGCLRHLLLRRAQTTGEILVCLVTSGQWGLQEACGADTENGNSGTGGQPVPEERALSALPKSSGNILAGFCERLLALRLTGRIVGILHMRNDSVADIVQSNETAILYGQDYFYETLLGLRFKITPFSFFQTNTLGAEVLYRVARTYIGDTKAMTLFDLYSGTGTIAQLLSPVAKKVIGVEIVEEAVAAARENAAQNGLTNCEFLAGDVLKVLDTIKERPDCIVLDPPRDGIHPKAMPKIVAYGAERILYISCKPTSLARDLGPLLQGGYRVERVCCVDMFPQTTGVECVTLLQKSNRKCAGNEPKLELAPDLGECRDTARSL